MITRGQETRVAFARRLIALRQVFSLQKGLGTLISQAGMARLLGIHHEQYRRYERGDTEPSIAVFTSIRQLTGVSLDILVAGEPPGSTTMIDAHGVVSKELTVGDGMRIARLAIAPNLRSAASLMNVDVGLWERWEAGVEEPPLDKLMEFAHRFGVGLDFLYRGQNTGVAPRVWEAMVRVHPSLDRDDPEGVASEPVPSSHNRKAMNGGIPAPKGKARASGPGKR